MELIDELKAIQRRVWDEGFEDYCNAQRCRLGLCDVARKVDPEQAKKKMREQQAPWNERYSLLQRLQITIDTLEKHGERIL